MLRELVNSHLIAEITIPVALGNTSLPGLITFVFITNYIILLSQREYQVNQRKKAFCIQSFTIPAYQF